MSSIPPATVPLMTRDEILRRKKELEDRYGPWVAHNYWLAEGVYSIDVEWGPNQQLRRIVQAAADLAGKPLSELRVLDLACMEGGFGLEFAAQGAHVVAIEGREANLARARFSKEVCDANRLELVQDDVRNLSPRKYGTFDVVLCLGILYHLDAPDLFPFLEQVAAVCDRLMLLETHVSPLDQVAAVWKWKAYWGVRTAEHVPHATAEEKLRAVLDSLDNEHSFCLTRPSLCNLLREVGFSSVHECLNPLRRGLENYTTLAAVKGTRVGLLTSPVTDEAPEDEWSEKAIENIYVPPPDFQWPGKPPGWGKPDDPPPVPATPEDGREAPEELHVRHAELVARFLRLEAEHLPFTSFGGALRQLPRLALRAIRRRLWPGDKAEKSKSAETW